MNAPPDKRRVAFCMIRHLMKVIIKIIKFSILEKLARLQLVKFCFLIRIKMRRLDYRSVMSWGIYWVKIRGRIRFGNVLISIIMIRMFKFERLQLRPCVGFTISRIFRLWYICLLKIEVRWIFINILDHL